MLEGQVRLTKGHGPHEHELHDTELTDDFHDFE
jgi:hypothetical protein